MGVNLGKTAYDAGKTALDASTGAAMGVTTVARDVTQATVQRITEVKTDVQGLASTGIAVAKVRATETKEKVVNILRTRATSGDQEPPLYWGEGTGSSAGDDAADEEYKTLLQFEKSQEISVLPGRRERLPYILKKGHTVTWEFRIKVGR